MQLFEGRLRGCRLAFMLCIVLLCIMLISNICMPIFAYAEDDGIDLFVLMYHNIVDNNYKGSKYEIREADLRRDISKISSLGYDVVTPSDLREYMAGDRRLSKRCVMLTFDDGYYSYIRHLLPLLDEYDMRAVVSVVGEYTKYNKNNPKTSPKYRYLDYEDMCTLRDSNRIEFGLHSYALHHIVNGVNGAGQRKGESDGDYRVRLLADTNRLIRSLSRIGIKTDIYTYPYGNYSRCSDRILSEVGIATTLSCNEGINHINRGSDLHLLKRYNRDGRLSDLAMLSDFFVAHP